MPIAPLLVVRPQAVTVRAASPSMQQVTRLTVPIAAPLLVVRPQSATVRAASPVGEVPLTRKKTF